jgi:hypothetical protein
VEGGATGCPGRPCRRPEPPGLGGALGRGAQLTATVCGEVAAAWMEMTALPPALLSLVTVTVTVTLCPAWRVPASLLRLTCAAEALADQLTGPPTAVSVTWPADPVPRMRVPGETARVPDGDGPGRAAVAPEAGTDAGVGAPGFGAGVRPGDSGAVASAIIASPRPPDGPAAPGSDDDGGATGRPEPPPAAAAAPTPGGRWPAAPDGEAAMAGVISRTAPDLPPDPGRTKAQAIAAAAAIVPAAARIRPDRAR